MAQVKPHTSVTWLTGKMPKLATPITPAAKRKAIWRENSSSKAFSSSQVKSSQPCAVLSIYNSRDRNAAALKLKMRNKLTVHWVVYTGGVIPDAILHCKSVYDVRSDVTGGKREILVSA
jgi:hypothetical protein